MCLKQIPNSTLSNWKHRDFNKLFGTDKLVFSEDKIELINAFMSRKGLYKAAKAMLWVHLAYQQLFEKVKAKSKIIRDSRELVVDTIEKVKDKLGFKRALRLFDISSQQFYAWKRKVFCPKELPLLCNKLFPNQVTHVEINTIRDYLLKPQFAHWSLASVYYKMIRNHQAFMSLTTFYKYARLLKLQRSKPSCRKNKNKTGIRASMSGQILHLDVTIFRTADHTRVFLYFLVDNFSRCIIGWRASLQYSSSITFDLMKEIYEKYSYKQLRPVTELIVDDGPENKGLLDKYLSRKEVMINKIIAQKDIVFSNSMVEAVNKRVKYDYLFTRELLNFQQTRDFLSDFAIDDYNHKPHYSLYGLSPAEAFNGRVPDRFMFRNQMIAARKQRIIDNIALNCVDCDVAEEITS